MSKPNESELRARHEGEIDPITGARRGGCICRHVPHVDCPVRDALTLLDAERVQYEKAVDACRGQVVEVRAQHEQQFREVRAALGVPDAMLLIDGARSIRAAYDKMLHDPERARDLLARAEAESLRAIIGDAKERLAKLTGTAFVHGPSLAQHIEKVEALVGANRSERDPVLVATEYLADVALKLWQSWRRQEQPPRMTMVEAGALHDAARSLEVAQIQARVRNGEPCPDANVIGWSDLPCLYCGKGHGPASRDAEHLSVRIEEDDGDPA